MTTQPITIQQAREIAAADAEFQEFASRPRTWLDRLAAQGGKPRRRQILGREALRVDDVTRPE